MAIQNFEQYIEVHRELYKHLHFYGDGLEVVLKGHLLLESILGRILLKSVYNSKKITEANLGFYKLACVTQAIHELNYPSWVWDAIFDLNSIRNKLAHNLEYSEFDERIELFTANVKINGNGTMAFGEELEFNELPMAIVNVHSELWMLLDAL